MWHVTECPPKFTPKTQSSVQVQDVTGRAAGVSSTVQLETDVQQQFYSNTVLRTCWNHSNLWLCAKYSVSMCFHWLQDHPCTPFEPVWACINLHMSAMSTLPFPAGNVGLWSSSPPNSYFQLLSATDLLIPTPRAQFAPFAQLSSCDHFVIFCWSCRSSGLTRSEGIETKQKKCRRHRGKYRFTSFSLAESSRPWRHPCLRSIWVGSQWIHLSMYNWTEGRRHNCVSPLLWTQATFQLYASSNLPHII